MNNEKLKMKALALALATILMPSLPLGGAGEGFYLIYVSKILHPSSGTTFRLLVVAGSSTVMP